MIEYVAIEDNKIAIAELIKLIIKYSYMKTFLMNNLFAPTSL